MMWYRIKISKAAISFLLVAVATVSSCSEESHQNISLSAPIDVTISSVGVTAASLEWKNIEQECDAILVTRSSQGSGFIPVSSVPYSETSWTDIGVEPNEQYVYRLMSVLGQQQSKPVEIKYEHKIKLPSPTEANCILTSRGLKISWTDNCIGEKGYLIRRKKGTDDFFSNWKWLSADATEVIDNEYSSGVCKYEIIAYYDDIQSEALMCVYGEVSMPKVLMGEVQQSPYMASVEVKLVEDGGERCSVGICWSEDEEPTLENSSVYTFSSKIQALEYSYGNATGLKYGKEYFARAWARNSKGIVYSESRKISLNNEPQPVSPRWVEINDYSLPSAITLYSISSDIFGRKVNAWYAIADLSQGNIEFYSSMRPDKKLVTVTDFVTGSIPSEDVYVMANGGYFDSAPQSFSYVLDRGSHLASNISRLTRGVSYSVTRGAFGVDIMQKPSIKWIYNQGKEFPWSYNCPLPVVEGEKSIEPTENFPEKMEKWNIYSAIGGGPVLLKNGRMCFDWLKTNTGKYKSNYELLQKDIFDDGLLSPRTAIGCTTEGKVVIMVVDGRNSGGSKGVALDELAMMMKGVGCTDALNLDGGGSSTICVTDAAHLLNSPSDGSQRRVCSFVGFVKRK